VMDKYNHCIVIEGTNYNDNETEITNS